MGKYYSTIEDVIVYTGIEPVDLKLDTEEELHSTIETWLIQVKSLMDRITERDFHKELEDGKINEIDAGLHNIALRITANMVLQAQIRKQTSTIEKDSNLPQLLQSSIITQDIREELEQYKNKKIESNDFSFFIRRVRNGSELS
ncbi:hypothetical protein SAMN04489735_100255 [Aneurinibacillus thermoaerophilus]|uniref:Uncharacterized protein n=1 Tax=Aneurinibacillus thermoaerophilus TaxID=143495 RepID=A0A1G7WQ20_ANETH|nr:hypothetical protein [Aneurinibacillus thermoaerophilus]SDG74019.1 hypothetical protein SAMN04489735_100255 [Aneurinibacillus thermoaerophilus]